MENETEYTYCPHCGARPDQKHYNDCLTVLVEKLEGYLPKMTYREKADLAEKILAGTNLVTVGLGLHGGVVL